MGVSQIKPSVKSQAGLQVFAPSPQAASKPVSIPVSKLDESLSNSNPSSSPAFEVQSGAKRDKPTSTKPSTAKPNPLPAVQLQYGETDQESPTRFSMLALFSFLPSWLVSMVFHLSILIALAVMTLTTNQDDRLVVLNISEAAEPLNEFVEVLILDDLVEDVENVVDDVDDGPVTDFEPILSAEMVEDFRPADENFANNDVDGGAALNQPAQPKGENEGENAPKKTAKFFGIESEGNRFVFVIDCSGSMAQEYRWMQAVEELRKSIGELQYSQEFVIYLYNHHTWGMLDSNPAKTKFLTADEENKIKVNSWLNRARPSGNTLPAYSMKLALEHEPDAIFMLSDGEIQDNTVGLLRTWNADERYGGTPIHTVFLGQGVGRMTMSAIAAQNNGTFRWVR